MSNSIGRVSNATFATTESISFGILKAVTPILVSLKSASAASLILYFCGFLGFLEVLKISYRLSLSPIANFPGPKIAAATWLYQFYFDVIQRGSYAKQVAKLHERYGPIVRVNPVEIHVKDATFYKELYVESSMRKSHKWAFSVGGVNLPGALPLTTDHDLHRIRRNSLNTFLSRRQVLRLEPVIKQEVSKLCSRLAEYSGSSKPVNMTHAYAAVTGDVVTTFCFARSYGILDQPDFAPHWEDVAIRFSQLVHLFNFFPWLIRIMRRIPRNLLALVDPRIILFFNREDMLEKQIKDVKEGRNMEKADSHPTMFHDLIYNSKLPGQELSIDRLRDEGSGVVGAGTVTTGRTLYVATYFLLANPHVLSRLQDELKSCFADYPEKIPDWIELEKLPYFTAVIYEALRLGYGAVHRLARVFPDTTMTYQGWNIPPNTPVSCSVADMHEDPEVFPEPQKFVPERWLDKDAEQLALLKRNWWPFSKGSRNCVGINLAWAELYITLAMVFRPDGLKMELFETTEKDALYDRDFYAAYPSLGTQGIRVLVK